MEEFNKIRERSEIPVEDTWATEDLYVSDEAWDQELETLNADKEILASFAGHLAESAEKLFLQAITISENKREPSPLIYKVIR